MAFSLCKEATNRLLWLHGLKTTFSPECRMLPFCALFQAFLGSSIRNFQLADVELWANGTRGPRSAAPSAVRPARCRDMCPLFQTANFAAATLPKRSLTLSRHPVWKSIMWSFAHGICKVLPSGSASLGISRSSFLVCWSLLQMLEGRSNSLGCSILHSECMPRLFFVPRLSLIQFHEGSPAREIRS